MFNELLTSKLNTMVKNKSSGPIEIEKLTLRDFLEGLGRLSLKTIGSLVTSFIVLFLGYTFFIYDFGYKDAWNKGTIVMNQAFCLKIKFKNEDVTKRNIDNTGMDEVTLPGLSLVTPFEQDGKRFFWIRRLYVDDDIHRVGQVKFSVENAKTETEKPTLFENLRKKFSVLTLLILGDTAFAQQLSMGVHANDNNYALSYSNANTIQRKFNDGCSLQFKIDSNGNSIPGSFSWISYKH